MTLRTFSCIALLLIVAEPGAAQVSDQLFQQGNIYYQQGNYASAVERYESILKTGVTSGELHFNLGNAYYKQGNMGKAILHYERALRLMPADEDLQHNLQLANLLIVDRIDVAPRLFIWDTWDAIKAWFSLSGITWTVWIIFMCTAAAVVVILLARSYALRKAGMIASLALGVLLLFAAVILVDKAAEAGRNDEAIVIAAITTVKNSPDAKSSDAFVLHAGVKVLVTDNVGSWLNIRLADGKAGWIEGAAVEKI